MVKHLRKVIFGIALLFTLAAFVDADGIEKHKQPKDDKSLNAVHTKTLELLTDGFFLSGVDGKLAKSDTNDGCFFTFDANISDTRNKLPAGTSIELMPSAALEKMLAGVDKNPAGGYRLWGRISKYKDKNLIFLFYFMPISDVNQSDRQKIQPAVNEPNDELPMPENIVAKLKARKVLRTEDLVKGLELKTDCILADRNGFIVNEGKGRFVFTLDAYGRNIQKISFDLLPCHVLELSQEQQASDPDPMRFKVAGVVTKYKDKYYLLLESATTAYSYGNLGR